MLKKIIKIYLIFFTIFSYSQIPDELDTSFGINGHFEHTVTSGSTLFGISIYDSFKLLNGKILAVGVANSGCGSSSSYYGIIIRFNVDGSLDASFLQNGFQVTGSTKFLKIIAVDNNNFYIKTSSSLLKIDSNGNIISSFTTPNIQSVFIDRNNDFITINKFGSDYKIGKILSDGSIVNSFGDNGYYNMPPNFISRNIILDDNDNIYITGIDNTITESEKLIVIKLNNIGVIDTSFGINGVFNFDVYTRSKGYYIQIDHQNRLLITGIRPGDYNYNRGLLLVRLDINGNIDTNFNGNGYTLEQINAQSTPRNIHLTSNGEIYVIGQGIYSRMYIVRFSDNGYIDTDFGSNGFILTEDVSTFNYAKSSILYSDYIILIGAKMFAHCNQSKYKATLSKYFIEENNLNINENDIEDKIEIFPNPAIQEINFSNTKNIKKTIVYNSLGQIIIVTKKSKINIEGLNFGVYYCKFEDFEGNIKIQKFIKQ